MQKFYTFQHVVDGVDSCNIDAIAIGRISVHKKDEQQVKRVRIEDPEQEILRYRQAKQVSSLNLRNTKYGPLAAYGHMGRTDLDVGS